MDIYIDGWMGRWVLVVWVIFFSIVGGWIYIFGRTDE